AELATAYTIYDVRLAASPLPGLGPVALVADNSLIFAALIPLFVLLFPDAVWQRFRPARGEERQQMRWLVAVAICRRRGDRGILLVLPLAGVPGLEESESPRSDRGAWG
ncbi:MAG TPA: hypothetical protein VIQ27_11880, partial [Gemmatimonadales bacterium]